MVLAASADASDGGTTVAPASAAAAAPAAAEDAHYTGVAQSYEAAFFYSSVEYRDWVMEHLLRHFGLPDEEARIVDLGGGTGNFTQALAVAARVRRRVLCVDAFAEMLQQALAHDRVEPMLLDAVRFAALPPGAAWYSHVLLKELVHHIPPADVPALYAGLHRQLAPGGVAVTITRPQDVDYPLFARAREIWREHQPHHSVFTEAMEAAGFSVEMHAHDYVAQLPKATWLGMMRARFWSTFSHCTQRELNEGIAEVEREYAGRDTVQFTDRLLFLVARKSRGGEAEGSAPAAAGGQASAAESPVLTPQQARQYAERGFTGPVDVLSREEAAQLCRRYEEYAASVGGAVAGDWRFKSHLLLPWVWRLAHHPHLVAAAAEALGGCRNVLLWSTDWFCKQPGDGGFTSWHQDSTYVRLEPPDAVTVWLALTPSDAANGCLRFQPGSHVQQLPHAEARSPSNLLLLGQTIQELEGVEGECVPLAPGQATLHHIRLAHRSGAAAPGSAPRLGLALRYMAAHVQQGLEQRDSVVVVAGRDTFGHYRHEAGPPATAMDAAALAEHRRAVARVYPPGFERGQQAAPL